MPGKGRRKAKRKLPLWALLPLLAIWLVTLCDDYRSIRQSPLEGWSMWRVADQDLMIETTRLPVPWGAADAAGDVVREGFADIEKLREKIRLAVRRTATRWTGKKPVVDVLLIAQ